MPLNKNTRKRIIALSAKLQMEQGKYFTQSETVDFLLDFYKKHTKGETKGSKQT